MKLPDFKIEKFFAKYEFSAPFILSASDMDSMTIPEILELADQESLNLWNTLPMGYTQVNGLPILRKEITQLYECIHEDQIATFAGAEEAIFTAFNVLLQPGDEVIAPAICYQSLQTIPERIGASVSLYPMTEQDGCWSFDVSELIRLISKKTRLIIINFPHNPTGVHINRQQLDEIVQAAKKAGAYLFSDEVYRFSEHDPSYLLPAVADLYDRGISLGVMSKSFGFAGLRIGWLATQDIDMLQRFIDFKCYLSICNSSPSEILSLICLRSKEKIFQKNLNVVHENLKILDSFFEKHDTLFTWEKPIAGTSAFPKLLLPLSIDQFVDNLIQDQGVLLLPSSLFEIPGNYFRLGFGRKNMQEALQKLENHLALYE